MLSQLDLGAFLPVTREALGRNLNAQSDADNLNPPLLHLKCIEAMQGVPATDMFHVGFLVAGDSEDISNLSAVLRLRAIVCDTVARHTRVALITGLLSEWQDALKRAGANHEWPEVREIAIKIFREFRAVGLDKSIGHGIIKVGVDDNYLLEFRQ